MGNKTKAWLIIGGCLILMGCILICGAMMAINWNWEGLATMKMETNEHELAQQFQNIIIDTDTADIGFIPSEGTECKVVCHEHAKTKHSVAVTESTLTIQVTNTRKWYEYIGINFGSPKITVYLPKGEYGALSLKGSTGNIKIPADFQFERMDISLSTGHATNRASTTGDMRIRTSTGNIRLENVSANAVELHVSTGNMNVSGIACSKDMNITVSTGHAKLTDIQCQNLTSTGSTGDLSLKNVIATEKFSIQRSTGDVKLDSCDAAELAIKTDTGYVKGTLLSDKVFITKTDTGNIDVPDTATGGKCQINTDTGDIKIQITK